MAIEAIDPKVGDRNEVKSQTSALIPIERGFSNTKIWMAGMLKVRSPFFDESMILYGFIGHYDKINIDVFKVNGMTILFANEDGDYSYLSTKGKVYPKVMADLKNSAFYELFPMIDSISLTETIWKDGSGRSQLSNDRYDPEKANYYFFESNIHPEPSVASDGILLVCKYIKDGKTKYALFAPHEVMLDKQ